MRVFVRVVEVAVFVRVVEAVFARVVEAVFARVVEVVLGLHGSCCKEL